ncbi:MAG: hypothetical protein PHH59_06010 [Methylovulum sp.]|uniref:hypothetical protein n=1 Tax=Methylovulum sp. TaxID=1916980 RepID=UPI00262C0A87|nr:hypothetical protein [Methylovulum sp.]MDD2723562.1 hypothetical protein [Methylovulum sp.]MDD5124172.1 hypothetical protein [Methylovulum sp.]
MNKKLKTIISFLLRLFLFTPFSLAAYFFDGLGDFFKRLADGLFDISTAMREITEAPYIKDISRKIDELKADNKLKIMENMREHLK